MKKFISIFFILALTFGKISIVTTYASETIPDNNLREIQTRTYNTNNSDLVRKSILEVLEQNDYKVNYQNKDLYYIKATKYSKVKDVNKLLIAGYVAKIGLDTFQAILTYGLKSYSVIGDIILIKIELKDKNLDSNIGINITPNENATKVRINMNQIMTGKRDGLLIGKQNRLKTIQIREEAEYKVFFYKLNKKLEEQNIKGVDL